MHFLTRQSILFICHPSNHLLFKRPSSPPPMHFNTDSLSLCSALFFSSQAHTTHFLDFVLDFPHFCCPSDSLVSYRNDCKVKLCGKGSRPCLYGFVNLRHLAFSSGSPSPAIYIDAPTAHTSLKPISPESTPYSLSPTLLEASNLLRGFAKNFPPKNPRLLWKWVGGSTPGLTRNLFSMENRPKIALNNQY